MSTIVVGVDGSPGSLHALRFAAQEARLRGAQLRVVLAWEYPVSYYSAAGWPFVDDELQTDYHGLVERRLRELVEDAAEETRGLDVVADALEGPAAPTLLGAAQHADLLVVGTRGHGGFVGLLLGSVSQQCAHHAPCPLVIVPPGQDHE